MISHDTNTDYLLTEIQAVTATLIARMTEQAPATSSNCMRPTMWSVLTRLVL